jgi:CRP/FNR family transcriptional regulator, cyclic AMP receptor protein
MSPPRESKVSHRPRPIDRISQRTRNSARPRRASRNGRKFDPHAFLATIGEGRKAVLFPKKHTIFAQGDLADAIFYLQTGKENAPLSPKPARKQRSVALHREHTLSDLFVAYLLARNIRYEEDLVDQLVNSSEKRLARVLLMLAHFGKEGVPETVVPKISQETLAEMVGTTRSRVSFFGSVQESE